MADANPNLKTVPPQLKEVLDAARLPTTDGAQLDVTDPNQIRGVQMAQAVATTLKDAPQGANDQQNTLRYKIENRIREIDDQIAAQLNSVLHHEDFQTLEATWRGLSYLVSKTETSSTLKLRVLDITKDELRNDLEKAVDFDQSELFKKVYEEEYGTLGGKPYGCLVGDFYFGRSTPDMILLKSIAQVAAMAHAPFIAAADPALFDMDSFTDLPRPRDLSKIFEAVDMAEWRAFRDSEDSRYVTLVLPRVLMRLPYDIVENPVDGLDFDEVMGAPHAPDLPPMPADAPPGPWAVWLQQREARIAALKAKDPKATPPAVVNGWDLPDRIPVEAPSDTLPARTDWMLEPAADRYLWGNPAYVLGERITNAFALYSWTAAIRGVEGGGKVEDLAQHKFKSLRGDQAVYVPTEVAITDRREKELSDQGFVSLVYCKDTNYAAFFGGQTVNKPKKYNLATANANANLSARLPYMLNASRFAHYIKVIMRDKIGSFLTKDNVQQFLTTWISDYVLDKDDAGQDLKARYPLREARIDVSDIPGRPGEYSATVFLRPHFQLEGLTTSIRLVAELPPPALA